VIAVPPHLHYQQAVERRRRLTFPFIGITGSNGKTTVKRMVKAILARCGRVYDFSDQSDSVHKIADELLNLEASWDWALVKIGANEPDGVRQSTDLVRPLIGVITNIGEAHLASHGSIEKISADKAQLLAGLEPSGYAVLNRDNDYTKALGETSPVTTRYFGLSELADFFAANISSLGPDGTAFTVHRKEKTSLRLHLPIYSMGDVYNALAAIAVTDTLGVTDDHIADGLEHGFSLPDGRGRLHKLRDLLVFDDTYDATPQSLFKSTRSLLQCKEYAKRLVLVLGDLADLGERTEFYQKMIGHYLAGTPIDLAVLCGRYAHLTAEAIRSIKSDPMALVEFESVEQVLPYLLKELRPGDAVMVEGGDNQDFSIVVQSLLQAFA